MKGAMKGKVKEIASPPETQALQVEVEVLRKRIGDKEEIIKELHLHNGIQAG